MKNRTLEAPFVAELPPHHFKESVFFLLLRTAKLVRNE